MEELFKDRLKKIMEIRGVTGAELSRRSNISKPQISEYLSGRYEAKQNKLHTLAIALDVSEAWLMGCDVPMERNVTEKTEDEILAFALWGNDPNITAEDIADVRRFAEFLRQKKGNGNDNK
jgi:transcriptional regulator with XRE-family HTH domain